MLYGAALQRRMAVVRCQNFGAASGPTQLNRHLAHHRCESVPRSHVCCFTMYHLQDVTPTLFLFVHVSTVILLPTGQSLARQQEPRTQGVAVRRLGKHHY